MDKHHNGRVTIFDTKIKTLKGSLRGDAPALPFTG